MDGCVILSSSLWERIEPDTHIVGGIDLSSHNSGLINALSWLHGYIECYTQLSGGAEIDSSIVEGLIVSTHRIGELIAESILSGYLEADTKAEGWLVVGTSKCGGYECSTERKHKMMLSTTFVCDYNTLNPDLYLEIHPTSIWLQDWGAFNEVESNTDWNIN